MLQAGIERAPLPPLRDESAAAAAPLPAATAPEVGKEQADQGERPARDAYLDNAKYLTIVLVAVGHAWAPLTDGSRSTSALYYLLYTFHMPAFIVISGYLSRSFEFRPRQVRRLITGLVVPYLVFQTLYTFFMRWAADDPDRELSYQEPKFALWFLVALCLWRLTAPVWKQLRWPLTVSVGVAVAAGVTPSVGDDLDLMRTAQFLPFFVLGLRLRPHHFEMVRHRVVRMVAVPVAAGALAVSYAAVPYISAAPFLHDRAAQDLDLPSWLGAAMTLTSFGCALVMTACFLAWVPQRHTWFTSLGAGTLGAYLLHVYPIAYAKQAGWFEEEGARHPLDRFAITVLAVLLMTLLCTAPVRRALRFVLEPRMRWFFHPQANPAATAASGSGAGTRGGTGAESARGAPARGGRALEAAALDGRAPRAASPGSPEANTPRLPPAAGRRAPELPPAPTARKTPTAPAQPPEGAARRETRQISGPRR